MARTTIALIFTVLLGLTWSTKTAAFLPQPEIDECLLTYLAQARLDSVSRLIDQTCRSTYRRPNFLNKRRRAYNFCLLTHLQGVESSFAANQIIQACNRKHLEW